MKSSRENTLVVDFSVLPKRPDAAKVQQFLEKKLDLQFCDVKNIQLHNIRNCVYIEMVNIETALRYQKAHNGKHVFRCADKAFKIPVFVNTEAVTVRVHDLPPGMSHTTITDHLTRYGEVISIRREIWKHYFPGFENGVRVVLMKLQHHIPSFITIENETTMVTYPNQPKTCRHCHREAHPKQKCNEPNTATVSKPDAPSPPNDADELFSIDEFPPMINAANTSASSSTTVKNNNDDDGNCSTSSTDFVEETNKRRLTTQKANDEKKVCTDQSFANEGSGSSDPVATSDRKLRSKQVVYKIKRR